MFTYYWWYSRNIVFSPVLAWKIAKCVNVGFDIKCTLNFTTFSQFTTQNLHLRIFIGISYFFLRFSMENCEVCERRFWCVRKVIVQSCRSMRFGKEEGWKWDTKNTKIIHIYFCTVFPCPGKLQLSYSAY